MSRVALTANKRRRGRGKSRNKMRENIPVVPILWIIGVLATMGGGAYVYAKLTGKDPSAPDDKMIPDDAGQQIADGMKWAVVPCTLAFLGYVFSRKYLQSGED